MLLRIVNPLNQILQGFEDLSRATFEGIDNAGVDRERAVEGEELHVVWVADFQTLDSSVESIHPAWRPQQSSSFLTGATFEFIHSYFIFISNL